MNKFSRLKIWLLTNLWLILLLISVVSAVLGTPTEDPSPWG
ncbi:MAG: hypothetical protein ACTSXW_03735 [Candidatus Baldrarchaeia archaeon]